jgi:hypothetical protein
MIGACTTDYLDDEWDLMFVGQYSDPNVTTFEFVDCDKSSHRYGKAFQVSIPSIMPLTVKDVVDGREYTRFMTNFRYESPYVQL